MFFYLSTYLDPDSTSQAYGIGGVFNTAAIASLLISSATGANNTIFVVLLCVFDIIIGVGLGFCSFFARKGKFTPLVVGTALYGVDALMLTLTPFQSMYEFQILDYFISVILHLFILGMLGYALLKRHQLFALRESQRKEMILPQKDESKATRVLSYRSSKRKHVDKETFGEKLDENEKTDD